MAVAGKVRHADLHGAVYPGERHLGRPVRRGGAVDVRTDAGRGAQERRQALAVRLDTTAARLPRVAEVVDIVTGPEAALAAQVVTAREEAERAATTASDWTRRAVRRLREAGWSLADVADILRITPQAVSKLDRSQRSSPSRAA